MILIYELFQQLSLHNETISVAESCTGGGLAYEISKLAGSSSIFSGGIIAYTDKAKENLLSISKDLLETKGAVSDDIALLMAKNCQRLFSSTWAISTTGFSGPEGGTKGAPIGTAFIGICGPNLELSKRFYFPETSRMEHREKTIQQALLWFLDHGYKPIP